MTRYDEHRLNDIASAIAAIREHLRRGDLDELEAAVSRLLNRLDHEA